MKNMSARAALTRNAKVSTFCRVRKSMTQIHATCVEIAGTGVLLRGESGSGKSDLALRLIDAGARLVADDRTNLVRDGDRVFASAPREIAGLLEVRGLGVVRHPAVASGPVGLVVDLVPTARVQRMPVPRLEDLLGLAVPAMDLAPFEAGAAAKVRLAADMVARGRMPVP